MSNFSPLRFHFMDPVSAPLFDSVKEKFILALVKTTKKTLFRTIVVSVETVGNRGDRSGSPPNTVRTRGRL